MNKFESFRAVCPFYNCETNALIICEGVEPNTTIHIAFGNQRRKKQYCEEYCYNCKKYNKCRVARMLEEKWDENENKVP